MITVLAILATPTVESATARLFMGAVKELERQGARVTVVKLYDHAARIPFFIPEPEKNLQGEQLKFFLETKEQIMAADRLLIAYPVYWYSVPGILKCWLDLITNYAWKFEGKRCAKALHHITHAFIINHASMSWWCRYFLTRNSATEQLKETFKFMGLPKTTAYELGGYGLNDAQVAAHQVALNKKLAGFV